MTSAETEVKARKATMAGNFMLDGPKDVVEFGATQPKKMQRVAMELKDQNSSTTVADVASSPALPVT